MDPANISFVCDKKVCFIRIEKERFKRFEKMSQNHLYM